VVLIHGLAGSTFTWRRTGPQLAAAGFRTLALDLRGYGLSAKSFEADHSATAQARLTTRVMEAVGIDRATLIGHSFGGAVALHLALTSPELVRQLVLISPWVPGDDPGLWPGELLNVAPIARWGRHAVRALVTPGRVDAVLSTLYRQPEEIAQAVAAGHLVPTAVLGWDEAVLAVIRDVGRSSLPGQLAELSLPTLIIWGGQDGWLSPAHAPRLRDQIGGARLVLIEEAGHLPFEEQPERFASEILPFLAAGE
jgi:pimeloyl-ACP methyl ester carboxylesterase